MIDYSLLPLSKGVPRVVQQLEKKRTLLAEERACRKAVDARDHHRCQAPRCRQRAVHKHHIVYRSRGGKWDTSTIVSLCVLHHQLIHAGLLRVSGNADKKLSWVEKPL